MARNRFGFVKPSVFISYSTRDDALAERIYLYLNNHGIKARKAPEDIEPGQDWAGAITNLIDASTHIVLIWTKHSMASNQVAKELALVANSQAVVLPYQAENIEPDGRWRYHLSNLHWLRAFEIDEQVALYELEQLIRQRDQSAEPEPRSCEVPVDQKPKIRKSSLVDQIPIFCLVVSIVALMINAFFLAIGIFLASSYSYLPLTSHTIHLIANIYLAIPKVSIPMYCVCAALSTYVLLFRSNKKGIALAALSLSLLQLGFYIVGYGLKIIPSNIQ